MDCFLKGRLKNRPAVFSALQPVPLNKTAFAALFRQRRIYRRERMDGGAVEHGRFPLQAETFLLQKMHSKYFTSYAWYE